MFEREVTAEHTKNGVVYYKGEPIHPAVIEKVDENDPYQVKMRELLDQALEDRDNLVNIHSFKVVPVKRGEKGALPHFRVNDPNYQDKLFALGVTLHDRFRDLMYDKLQNEGSDWFFKSVYFDDMDQFQYGSCSKETMLEGYRPDITVSHRDASVKGKIALEVINTSPPSEGKNDALTEAGHIILRLNIKAYAESCALYGFNPTDNDLEQLILKKRFRLPRTADRSMLQSVVLIWTDLLAKWQAIRSYKEQQDELWMDDYLQEKRNLKKRKQAHRRKARIEAYLNASGRYETWSGKVVSNEEFETLSEWDKYGPGDNIWCGICRAWKPPHDHHKNGVFIASDNASDNASDHQI